MNDRPLVLYHANCPDDFCAAWVAHRKLGDDADYEPVSYGQPPPDVRGRTVYILDFSYKRPVMREVLSQAHFVAVLDHHKTAEAELAGIVDEFVLRPDLIANPLGSHLPIVHFDMDKSGARLAWEHFFPKEEAPWRTRRTEEGASLSSKNRLFKEPARRRSASADPLDGFRAGGVPGTP